MTPLPMPATTTKATRPIPMEISFCERYRESIPDADFDAGKAVRVAGRPSHVACAFRHTFPGRGRSLAVLLALLAAGAATYAAVRVVKLDQDLRADRTDRQEAFQRLEARLSREGTDVSERVNAAVATQTGTLRREQEANLSRLAETLRSDLKTAKDAARVETEKQLDGWAAAHDTRFTAIEKRLGDLGDWIRDVRDLAKKAAEMPTAPPPPSFPPAAAGGPPAPAPTPTPPTPAPVDPDEAK